MTSPYPRVRQTVVKRLKYSSYSHFVQPCHHPSESVGNASATNSYFFMKKADLRQIQIRHHMVILSDDLSRIKSDRLFEIRHVLK